MESKKINQLATELTPSLSDLTIIGDPSTGISKKITLSQMASLFTGTVEEYANLAAFPLVGVADTIYIALDTNVLYRWNTGTNAYVELSPNIINSLVFNDANGFDGTIALVGSVATLTITTALTTGSVGFIGASGALLQDNANFFWDDTNNRLGIGTNAPTTAIDTFGSGIITRVNGTSTNNAFIGFASAGTNKWSVGNVQSDHRFRIYNEATTSELVSVLQTGEFGIGIANPTTKLHIDGGASALIANLDANVSVAKSISFRSDNSNRINLEVSGTESGSNVGADLFVRTYTDLGALIETPLSIVRSTGVTTIKSLTLTNALSIANGGTGSTTQNFVDLTTTQSIGGAKTFTSALAGTSATFSSTVTSLAASGQATIIAEGSATNGEAAFQVKGKNSSGTARSAIFKYDNADVLRIGIAQAVGMQFETSDVARVFIASGGRVQLGFTGTPSYTSYDLFVSRSDQFGGGIDVGSGYTRFRGDDDALYINRGGTDVISINSSNLVTFSSGAKASSFNTASGNASIITQSSGWSTFYTVSNYNNAIYLVTLQLNGYSNYIAYATIAQNDSALVIMNQYNSTAQIRVSGLDIQGTQNSGSTQTMIYKVLRIQ